MKRLLSLVLLIIFCVTSTGCWTPAHTGRERRRMIARNWGYEYGQINDDIDSVLLLRPAGSLSIWHLQ